MSAPKTVQYFGYYLYIVAATLIFVPNLLLGMLQVPETTAACWDSISTVWMS